jgi:hypothetical protein
MVKCPASSVSSNMQHHATPSRHHSGFQSAGALLPLQGAFMMHFIDFKTICDKPVSAECVKEKGATACLSEASDALHNRTATGNGATVVILAEVAPRDLGKTVGVPVAVGISGEMSHRLHAPAAEAPLLLDSCDHDHITGDADSRSFSQAARQSLTPFLTHCSS